MVEKITNPEELSQVPKLLAAQAERKKELGKADEERGEGCVCVACCQQIGMTSCPIACWCKRSSYPPESDD